ncbi:MAG: hypothetical protein RIA69_08230, partial [Cyclobacteriaceae bacterium]
MNKSLLKKLSVGLLSAAAVLLSFLIINTKLHSDRVPQVSPKKHVKKSIVDNGVKYDGPEKIAFYQSAIRAGQTDLENEKRYPQYAPFQKSLALKKAKQRLASRRIESNATNAVFTERGPVNVPGRTRVVLVDPDDDSHQTWFAGNVSGGIWKTSNAGNNWTEVAPDLKNMAITTMAMSAANTNVIYAGTGEGFVFSGTFILNGEGIYKSTDKGASWTLLESTVNDRFINVSRIIVDPSNENLVIASTSGYKQFGSGAINPGYIMRSEDGGETWTEVANSSAPFQQIIYAPSDFSIQYAALNGIGVKKSTDRGLTWIDVNNGLEIDRRIELAVSYSDPDVVWASTEGAIHNSDLFYTKNGGSSWDLVNVSINGGAYLDFLGGQGWYDNAIQVNPYDDSKVYFGGVFLYHVALNASKDSDGILGSDTRVVADVYRSFSGSNSINYNVHPDQHFMQMIKTNEANEEFEVLLCNDGGMYLSNPSQSPGLTDASWRSVGRTYNTTQFYGADKFAGKNAFGGGAQDNGTWISNGSQETTANTDYRFVIGGDGFEVATHYTDPLKFIGGSQFNGFGATVDGGSSFYNATNGLTGNNPFVSRLSASFQDPDRLYAVTGEGVFRSNNWGKSWIKAAIETNWGFWSGIDVEVSKANPQVVWAGGRMTENGSIFVSRNGGNSFEATKNFANLGLTTGLYSDYTDPATAFVVLSVANSPKILKTSNYGESWEDISGFADATSSSGFPDVATFAVMAMPFNKDIIWAGTEIGIFETVDGGSNWYLLDQFPSVTIWDFIIKDGEVVIATHGRGIWSAALEDLKDFTAPTVTLPPRIVQVTRSLEDLSFTTEIAVVSALDSLKLTLNDEVVATYYENQLDTFAVETKTENAGNISLQVIGYLDGEPYQSSKEPYALLQFQAIAKEYGTSFKEVNPLDFQLDRWNIESSGELGTELLATEHPYLEADALNLGEVNLIASLNVPIIVSQENPFIKFDEIVLVETGEPGTQFGDQAFWDYVIVEGTKDGSNWIPLIPGYDSNANDDWNYT